MKYLESFDFTSDSILNFVNNTATEMINLLEDNKKLVKANLEYLIDLGAKNYQEIFFKYYELFLMDNSNFVNIFNKYDREDLVEKLEKNVGIVEYL